MKYRLIVLHGETGTLLYLTFVKDRVTPSEIAENLSVSMPRIMSVLNALEVKKLICKSLDKNDKRKTIINITKSGRELVLNKKQEAIEKITKIIEMLDEYDIDEYIKLSKKIGKIMDDMNN